MKLSKLVTGIAIAACAAVVLSKKEKVEELADKIIDKAEEVLDEVTKEREEKTVTKKIENIINIDGEIKERTKDTIDKAFDGEGPDRIDDMLSNLEIAGGVILILAGGATSAVGIVKRLRRRKLAWRF